MKIRVHISKTYEVEVGHGNDGGIKSLRAGFRVAQKMTMEQIEKEGVIIHTGVYPEAFATFLDDDGNARERAVLFRNEE